MLFGTGRKRDYIEEGAGTRPAPKCFMQLEGDFHLEAHVATRLIPVGMVVQVAEDQTSGICWSYVVVACQQCFVIHARETGSYGDRSLVDAGAATTAQFAVVLDRSVLVEDVVNVRF